MMKRKKYTGLTTTSTLAGAIYLILLYLLSSCANPFNTSSTSNNHSSTLSTSNGSITYSTNPQDVLLRTFYGGGKTGSLELSPEISIYGDGTYILGPELQMREGVLDSASLQQLLHVLVGTDGLLGLHRQEFSDVPDQNVTLLQLNLNGKDHNFQYGKFGIYQENAQDLDEYHRLGQAISTISQSLTGSTHPYTNKDMALLVHQNFSPDLSHDISTWSLQDLALDEVATYECGIIPHNTIGPNADTGCLTFTIPFYAYLPTAQQLQEIKILLEGHQEGVFYDRDSELYYSVAIRPLLPDETPQQMLAMFGSEEFRYAGVPLHQGPIPTPTPTGIP